MTAHPDQYPFYFAVPAWASAESRARVPQHLKAAFGIEGRIEHVRSELAFRLYRVVGGA